MRYKAFSGRQAVSGKGRMPKEKCRGFVLVLQITFVGLSLFNKAERYMFMVLPALISYM